MGTLERVLIADDEPLAREWVRQLILGTEPRAHVFEAGDGDAAVEAIRVHAPNVVLLDIEMPGRRGFEVIEAIGPYLMPATVFVTAYDEYALAAFDVAAVDYLLKPISADRFQVAWKRIEERLAVRDLLGEAARLRAWLSALSRSASDALPSRLVLREAGRSVVVPLGSVRWIESSGNHVILHTTQGDVRVRETMTAIEGQLDLTRFARIHRRFIVAVDALREVRPWSGGDQLVILEGGAKLPVSRNYRQELTRLLQERR